MMGLLMTGCDQKPVVRVYEDINTPVIETEMAREALPQGHPPDRQQRAGFHDRDALSRHRRPHHAAAVLC